MFRWVRGEVDETSTPSVFRGNDSVLEGGSFGGIFEVVTVFRALRENLDRTEDDIREALEVIDERLEFLGVLAASPKPLRHPDDDPEGYTRGAVASAATLWHICGEMESAQLADLMEVCAGIVGRAPWYAHVLNS